MLRTTIYLEEETAIALRRLADVHGRSQADLIREAINSFVDRLEQAQQRELPPGTGRYKSGLGDVSDEAERILRRKARSKRDFDR